MVFITQGPSVRILIDKYLVHSKYRSYLYDKNIKHCFQHTTNMLYVSTYPKPQFS